jgi:hypothetical protein
MSDFKTIAEQIVADWPKLSTEQQTLVGSIIGGDK